MEEILVVLIALIMLAHMFGNLLGVTYKYLTKIIIFKNKRKNDEK